MTRARWLLVALIALLAGCAAAPPPTPYRIDTSFTAKSQDSRVQFLVLHFTESNFDSALGILTEGPVSAHYLVREDGTVYRLVDENRRAWHAGLSSWQGNTQLNSASIGIEVVNRGFNGASWAEYPPAQVDAIVALVKDIAVRHGIRPDHIVGHNEVAPQRKDDPGPMFPWKRLAQEGLVAWPDAAEVERRKAIFDERPASPAWFQERLAEVGYAVPATGTLDDATRRVLRAFQMRYRPARFDGMPDAESAAILDVLTSPGTALDDELAAIANDPAHRLASLSVLAIRNGRVAYERQFGNRFMDEAHPEANKRANETTLYRVASISKLVVTIGLMRLVEERKVALDEDVSQYLGWRLRNPHFPDTPITLRMLLTHRSSLRDDAFYFWPAKHALKDVLLPGGELYGEGLMWARNAPPGAYFSYCNLNWGVIGTVMERVTGERFDRLMARLVLQPLGIRGGFNPAEFPADVLGDTAAIYCKCKEVGDKTVWDAAGPWVANVDDYSKTPPQPRTDASYVIGSNGTVFGPQGNLRISAAGLGKIMRLLMNDGALDGVRLLEPATVRLMLSEQWHYDGRGNNGQSTYGDQRDLMLSWGLGNQHFRDEGAAGSGDRLVEDGGFTAIGHLGDAYGLTGVFAFNPSSRNGLVVLVGGTAFDPTTYPGAYSALRRHEERILTTLYRRAILMQ